MSHPNSFCGNAPGRAFGAWLLASYAAGVLISFGYGGYVLLVAGDNAGPGFLALTLAPAYGLVVGMVVAVLTALPMPLLTGLVRWRRWPRPVADGLVGVLMGAGLIQLFGAPITWPMADEGPGLQGLLLTGLFAIAGAMSGWVYWRLAGRPGRAVNPAGEALASHVFD